MINKTLPNDNSVTEFLSAITPRRKREDSQTLDNLFRHVTGAEPQMWGDSLIGYGRYEYRYESGRKGTFLATGFSPRKANLSIYIMPGYADFSSILNRLGKHKTGAACLYINKLADVDLEVFEEVIRAGLTDLKGKWPVQM